MPDISQNIKIKADFEGLDSLRQAKTELQAVQEAAGERGPAADVKKASGMQKQINLVRQMNQVTTQMIQRMQKGEMIGTSKYIKNLDQSLKKMKAMSDVVDDMGEEETKMNQRRRQAAGVTGGGVIVGAQGIGSVAGAIGGGNALAAGTGAVQMMAGGLRQRGIAMQQEGGGGMGAGMAALGTAGIVAAVGMRAIGAISQFVSGKFEERAPQVVGLEQRRGRTFTADETNMVEAFARSRLINQAEIISGMEAFTRATGRRAMTRGQMGGMVGLQQLGVNAGLAGLILGQAGRAGIAPGGISTMGGDITRIGMRGGIGQGRLPEFVQSVSDLTQEMHNMGEIVSPENFARILSDFAARGEVLRGTSGVNVARNMNRAIMNAQNLTASRDALLFRSLWTGDYSTTLDRMAEGMSDPKNLDRVMKFVKGTTTDKEARIALLRDMGLSRQQAKGLLAAPKVQSDTDVQRIGAENASEYGKVMETKIREVAPGQTIGTSATGVLKDVMENLSKEAKRTGAAEKPKGGIRGMLHLEGPTGRAVEKAKPSPVLNIDPVTGEVIKEEAKPATGKQLLNIQPLKESIDQNTQALKQGQVIINIQGTGTKVTSNKQNVTRRGK